MIRKPMRYGGAGSCMLVDSDDENLNIGENIITYIIYFDYFFVFLKNNILLKLILYIQRQRIIIKLKKTCLKENNLI